jgi:hypothetical protein
MLWLVPTLRPNNARRLIEAFANTKTLDTTELIFIIDHDDPNSEQFMEVFLNHDYDEYGWLGFNVYESHKGIRNILNGFAIAYRDTRKHIGFMGDDHLPVTPGWDARIEDVLTESPVRMVYTNDLIQGPNLPTLIMMTSNIIKTLGYMIPGAMRHLYIDNVWKSLGESTGIIRYIPDVIIQHLHPVAAKAEWDSHYVESNSGQRYQEDGAAYSAYMQTDFGDDVAKIQALIASGK